MADKTVSIGEVKRDGVACQDWQAWLSRADALAQRILRERIGQPLDVELNNNLVAETREINDNTLIDLDASGNLVALTLEHARGLTELSEFSLHQVVTPSP